MRKEYDFQNLNPRKNPYISQSKRQITIKIDTSTIDYFEAQSKAVGIPCQALISLYLKDCAVNNRTLDLPWQQP